MYMYVYIHISNLFGTGPNFAPAAYIDANVRDAMQFCLVFYLSRLFQIRDTFRLWLRDCVGMGVLGISDDAVGVYIIIRGAFYRICIAVGNWRIAFFLFFLGV